MERPACRSIAFSDFAPRKHAPRIGTHASEGIPNAPYSQLDAYCLVMSIMLSSAMRSMSLL